MRYQDAIASLNNFVNYERISHYDYRDFNLERIYDLLKIFGSPQHSLSVIHIAGSKAKGSTSAICYEILKAHGLKVGLYTSPHLLSIRERIRFSLNRSDDPLNFGDTISQQEFSSLFAEITNSQFKAKWSKATFFEIITVMAMIYFERKGCEYAIFETGLGGRLDATNTVIPLVCGITPIELEHTDKLGSTIKEIAREKVEIIKKNTVCVSALQHPDAMMVIEEKCNNLGVRLIKVGDDIKIYSQADGRFSISVEGNCYQDLKLSLEGKFQQENTAHALGLLTSLRGFKLNEEKLNQALKSLYWPGRLQVVLRKPLVILDCAHTLGSMRRVAEYFNRNYPTREVKAILGFSKDKDVVAIANEVAKFSQEIYLTSAQHERAYKVDELFSLLKPYLGRKLKSKFASIQNIFDFINNAALDDIILITGSTFLVADCLKFLKDEGIF